MRKHGTHDHPTNELYPGVLPYLLAGNARHGDYMALPPFPPPPPPPTLPLREQRISRMQLYDTNYALTNWVIHGFQVDLSSPINIIKFDLEQRNF